ncbi:MAG: fumarylacetoacetate hydrolase family protein [Leadbetterella sp.]
MKILCIGRNYVDHIKELNNDVPDEPVIFSKPETAILKNNEAFYYPDFSKDIHYEVEILVKISKMGKNIEEKFAHKYYEEIGLGIDFTARDIQTKLKSKGLPWDLAKGFDGSAIVSSFVPKGAYDVRNLDFSLDLNDERKQSGNTQFMIHSIDSIIAFVSQYFTLKVGDILFTGTPAGVGGIQIGDILIGKIAQTEMFRIQIK